MLPQQLDPSSVGSLMCAKPVQHGTLVFCLILHLHLFLNWKGYCSTTDDFTTTFLHFSLFSTALWDLAISRPVHSLMLSFHLFLCLPCLLSPFTMPCKMFWTDLMNGICFWLDPMNGRHDHITTVCASLQWSGGLRVVRLPAGSLQGLPRS